MSQPTEVTIKLDLDSYLTKFGGYNEDGDREISPTTLEAIVIRTAASQIVDQALGAGEVGKGLRSRVSKITDDEIRSRIVPMVEEAIAAPIRKTNTWGEVTGGSTTLREVIVQAVDDYLKAPADRYSHEKGTVIQAFIRKEVEATVKAELSATLTEAKAQVFGAVKANAASMIAEAVRKAMVAQ